MDVQIINTGNGDTFEPAVTNSYSILSQPAYWRAINFLADNLASFDIEIWKDDAKFDGPHPLKRLFSRRANPTQTAHSYWHTHYYHAEHHGNGYGYIRRKTFTADDIDGVYNLLPEDVTPFRVIPESGNRWDASVWYWHSLTKQAFPSADIIHFHGLAYDGLLGYSPSQVMQPTFRKASALERYSLRTMERGTNIKGSVEFPEKTGKETIKEVIDTLKQFRNATGDRDILVLSGGAKLNNAGLSPADLQLDAQDAAMTKKISQITGVDPRFLFERSETKYANAEAAGDDVVRFVFRTRIENYENELTIKLLSEAEQDDGFSIRLNANALTRGDEQKEMAIASQGATTGITTRNEGRERLGLPADPNPESDQIATPTHLVAKPEAKPDGN